MSNQSTSDQAGNRDRAERIVHALSQYLSAYLLAADDRIANPEEAVDTGAELLVQAIEESFNEMGTS